MNYYAVIDTNVLISALLSEHDDAATVKVFNKLLDDEVIPLYSDEILVEYNDVLHRKKFSFSEDIINGVLSVITSGVYVEPASVKELLIDPDDTMFYEIVLEKQDENAYLITGNLKHFPKKSFIVTAAEFIKIIEENK